MRDLPQPPKLLPGKVVPGKLLVVEQVIHHLHDQQPTLVVDARYSRWLGSTQNPSVDELEAGAEWQEVQVGRLQGAGLVVVVNQEGTDLVVVPTQEEREARARRVVGVVMWRPETGNPNYESPPVSAHLEVPSGETARFRPGPGVRVWVRCQDPEQTAKVRVTTLPA
jgi:hypothetical protein